MATVSYPNTGNCLWCSRPLVGAPPSPACKKHSVCDNCTIKNSQCRSPCPCCWYENGTTLLAQFNVCSACGQPIAPTDAPALCFRQHRHCARCSPSACNLCKFVEFRSVGNVAFENFPLDWRPIILACHEWQQKFEQWQQSVPQRQDSSGMDTISTATSSAASANTATANCVICLEALDATSVRMPICQHDFHRACIETWFQSSGKQSCPTCGYIYGILKGPQPALGEMVVKYVQTALPGFTNEQYATNEPPTIAITYTIPSGVQGPTNPNPGQPFTGTVRTAYLPNTQEGKHILQLLRRAFDDQHIFTVGRSSTTGQDNVVIWNDIHHKTSMGGGSENFGYPDPTYLARVRRELADKGYK